MNTTVILTEITKSASKAVVGYFAFNTSITLFNKITKPLKPKLDAIENKKIQFAAGVGLTVAGIVVSAAASAVAQQLVEISFETQNEIENLMVEFEKAEF